MSRRVARYAGVPLTLPVVGIGWMALATYLFQRETGRPFYGLAGNHYSVPEWGFA